MLTYAKAEEALAWLSDASRAQSTFRARLKHLKKLGVPIDVSPGRGKKILYGKEELYQWAFCLELMQFGIDPSVIVGQVKQSWPQFLNWMESTETQAAKRDHDRFLFFVPQFISAASAERSLGTDAFTEFQLVDRRKLSDLLANPHFHRAGIINMSETVRILMAAWTHLEPQTARAIQLQAKSRAERAKRKRARGT